MKKSLNIVIAQLNYHVGALKKNADLIISSAKKAKQQFNADLIVFPELALTGYLPEDLLLRADLHDCVKKELERIQQQVQDLDIILGFPEKTPEATFNSAAYIQNGKIIALYHKHHLPNYGVFDEKRYFTRGLEPVIVDVKGIPVGLLICEDLWRAGPCSETAALGAKLIIDINASPYDRYKSQQREELVRRKAKKNHVPIIYAHCVGGQDEVVFDGGSFVVDAEGGLCSHAHFFEETLFPVNVTMDEGKLVIQQQPLPAPLSTEEHVYDALTLGVKDYVLKNGFTGALIGLSGGIDSALTLTIAVDALGKDNVEAIIMPSKYSAQMSLDDAIALATNLGVKYHIISIDETFNAFVQTLQPYFANIPHDKTEENLQARCRGVILMAFSNKFGKLVLTTGNKSEMGVGYATLYGDMAGGFAVLKDVSKTLVYQLANYRNHVKQDIPLRIITRAPSAELAPNQTDQDTLPPYSLLDQILELYVEHDNSADEIIAKGFKKETVVRIIKMVDANEYKRRQAPPGIRITRRAFGRERRYPISSGFKL